MPHDGVDLHLHTVVYDGHWTPEGLVRHAAARGIRCIAISDHDAIDGIAPAQAAARESGTIVLPAVEVTTEWRGGEYHVLVYGGRIAPPASELGALLRGIVERQQELAVQWVQALARRQFTLFTLEKVRRGRPLMPMHVIAALLRQGLVPSYAACAALVRSLECSVTAAAPLAEVAAAAHAAKAVALVAHPGRSEHGFQALAMADLAAMVAEGPLDGLEVFHPNHTPAMREAYLRFAQERNLLVSAGSDSHGPAHARVPAAHPAEWCWRLLERCLPEATAAGVTADIARVLAR